MKLRTPARHQHGPPDVATAGHVTAITAQDLGLEHRAATAGHQNRPHGLGHLNC